MSEGAAAAATAASAASAADDVAPQADGWLASLLDTEFSPGLIGALAAAAVLLFWVVGAYNRLTGLRNGVAASWAKVQQTLQQRAEALTPLVTALRGPLAAEHGALDAVLVAHAEAQRCAAAMQAAPVSVPNAQAWVTAEAALAAATSRVLALVSHTTGLRDDPALAPVLARCTAAQERLPFVRQLFNESATAYNEAVALFPTKLVASGFGLRPAGLI